MVGAFFDVDGTLTSDNVWKGIMAFFKLRRQRQWTHRWYLATHYPLAYLRPRLVSETTFRSLWASHLPWYFRGFDSAQMQELAEWVVQDFVAQCERATVVKKLHEHVERGDLVALVSGAPQPLVEAIARRWAVPHAIGSPAEFQAGRYTGRMAGPPCIDTHKAVYVRRYLEARTLPVDFPASYAYADSVADRGLFELVGHPVAVFPDPPLRALAQAEHWTILQ